MGTNEDGVANLGEVGMLGEVARIGGVDRLERQGLLGMYLVRQGGLDMQRSLERYRGVEDRGVWICRVSSCFSIGK